MRKTVAIAALSAGLAGGAIAGTLFTPIISGAQTAPPSTQAPDAGSQPGQGQPGPRPDRAQKTKDALQELVTQGVITQAQADAVLAKLQSIAPPEGGRGGPGGPGGHRGPKLDVAASAIGISEEQLQQELQAGKSLADVAKAHNVDPQKVIDALVAEAEKHLADEVAAGKHTQQEADQEKGDLAAKITERVNNAKPAGGEGHGPRGRGGPNSQAPQNGQSGQSGQAPTTPGTAGGN